MELDWSQPYNECGYHFENNSQRDHKANEGEMSPLRNREREPRERNEDLGMVVEADDEIGTLSR